MKKKKLTHTDIAVFREKGSWLTLEWRAQQLIKNAASIAKSTFAPSLGGGTRLMLALSHRISHDIDLFISSPAWIGYVSPRLVDDFFVSELKEYDEQSGHVRWVFEEGEIDFIVSSQLLKWDGLWNPESDETSLLLEPPLEIIAKKLFYRGWALTPRDLFDWYCLVKYGKYNDSDHEKLAFLLESKLDDLLASIESIQTRIFFKQSWDNILSPFSINQDKAINWAMEQVQDLKKINDQNNNKIELGTSLKPSP